MSRVSSLVTHPNKYMELALEQARLAAQSGEVPVGAVIVHQDKILTQSRNQCVAQANPLEHAEILAIRKALQMRQQNYLEDCALYVTLEPCAMCAGAIAAARISKLYFGAYDPKSGGTEHGARIFEHAQCHWKPDVYGGIMEYECASLLTGFFTIRR